MKTIASDIKNEQFKRIYLLCGEEDYLKTTYKNMLINAVVRDNSMNIARFEEKGIDVNEVIESAETFPFFAEHRMVLIEDSGLLKSGGDALAEYMEKVPETTVFLLVETEIDKRSKLYKAIKKSGYICEIGRQTEHDLALWGARIFARDNKKITRTNIDYLISKVGDDMEVLSREIEKLISYDQSKDIIEKEDIDAVCITQLNVRIFDMIDAISMKNQKKTLDSYYELIAEKEPPMRILFMLSRQFNLMLQAKDLNAAGMSQNEIATAMNVQGFIAKKCVNQSRNFSFEDLKNGLRESISTEQMIKSGEMDENIGVELLLVKYSRKK